MALATCPKRAEPMTPSTVIPASRRPDTTRLTTLSPSPSPQSTCIRSPPAGGVLVDVQDDDPVTGIPSELAGHSGRSSHVLRRVASRGVHGQQNCLVHGS